MIYEALESKMGGRPSIEAIPNGLGVRVGYVSVWVYRVGQAETGPVT